MKFSRIILILILFLSVETQISLAQEMYEMTNSDITKVEGITSTSISVLGISLGMKSTETLNLLEKYPEFLTWNSNEYKKNTICVNLKKSNGSKDRILVSYELNDKKCVESISICGAIIPYLVGDSKRLLTLEMGDASSPLRKAFLGYPTRHNIDQWIETDNYDIKGIDVIHHNPSWFAKVDEIFIVLR